MKAMTVRLEDDFYKEVKKILIDKNMSFQDYVIYLIKLDIFKYDERIDLGELNSKYVKELSTLLLEKNELDRVFNDLLVSSLKISKNKEELSINFGKLIDEYYLKIK